MLLTSLVPSAVLLFSLSCPALVSGLPQTSDSGSSTTSQLSFVVSATPSSQSSLSSTSSVALSQSGSASSPASSPSICTRPSGSGPSGNGTSSGSPGNSTSSNSTSSGGQFVIYSDKEIPGGFPDASKLEGYTVFALSFLLSKGPFDQAQNWANLDEAKRKDVKSKYNAVGIKLIVSAFGSTEEPTTSGFDPTKTANDMASWVKEQGLDGIDVDYEDLTAMNKADGKAEEWLTTFTKTLRSQLPEGQFILTHAPVAPWFNKESYASGAYQTVHKNVGDMIDWYNVQFYNQNDYEDCNTLVSKSKTKTSLSEIAASGIDKNKLVIGKPATAADATNGYMDPRMLAQCVAQAKEEGWSAGAMVWQYPNADSNWIRTVRGDAFPMGK